MGQLNAFITLFNQLLFEDLFVGSINWINGDGSNAQLLSSVDAILFDSGDFGQTIRGDWVEVYSFMDYGA